MSDDWLNGRAKAMRREPALYGKRFWALLRYRRLPDRNLGREVIAAILAAVNASLTRG